MVSTPAARRLVALAVVALAVAAATTAHAGATAPSGCCALLCPSCICLWRSTVATVVSPAWKGCLPLGCVTSCIDAGWPRAGRLTGGTYVDPGALAIASPLVLYDTDLTSNTLRLVKSGGVDVTLAY